MKVAELTSNCGTVVTVRGSVVDVHFPEHLPAIYSVLRTQGRKPFTTAAILDATEPMIADQSIDLQLRFIQTMKEISGEQNTTTFLPLPLDLFKPFLKG
jgi:F0F1-type ATP synthase beta subunit